MPVEMVPTNGPFEPNMTELEVQQQFRLEVQQRQKSSGKRRRRPKVKKKVYTTPTLPPILEFPETPDLQPESVTPSTGTGIRRGTKDIVLKMPLGCPMCQLGFVKRQRLREHIIFHVMVEGRRGIIPYR